MSLENLTFTGYIEGAKYLLENLVQMDDDPTEQKLI